MKIPPRTGTCYVDVYEYFCYENELPDAILVHGVLHGINDLEGWIYGHAWIEMGDVVFQPVKQNNAKTHGLAFVNRKELFYAKYKIEEKTIRRYKKNEVLDLAIKAGHFGPWHELGLGKLGYAFKPEKKL